jgi:hypothetical protein
MTTQSLAINATIFAHSQIFLIGVQLEFLLWRASRTTAKNICGNDKRLVGQGINYRSGDELNRKDKKGRDVSPRLIRLWRKSPRPYYVNLVLSVVDRICSYAPLRFFSSSINCGTTLKRSPTTPKSEY